MQQYPKVRILFLGFIHKFTIIILILENKNDENKDGSPDYVNQGVDQDSRQEPILNGQVGSEV